MISIGLVSSSTETELDKYCHIIMMRFEDERIKFTSSPSINIVFHSPLSIKKPDHSGMIYGPFSKKRKKILVAIAVPKDVVERTTEEIRSYVNEVLHEAADFGMLLFQQKSIPVDTCAVHKFIDDVVFNK